MSMGGLLFTYHPPGVELTDEEWEEVCLDERDHPDPAGLAEWQHRAVAALRRYRPNLANTEPMVLDDGEGPVYLIASVGYIQMKPVKRYQWPDGVDRFEVWWGYCQAIALAGPTYCFDLDNYVTVGVTIEDPEEASWLYSLLL